ncbi:MAG: hypothetical protein DRJ68_00035 [Thermoprotei archaeon]|nr:MAG: hypothetical protein DRJ62_02935 [Thermoprotei archaeon]RLF23311.1 MAG: hypothetical protein DRJ68_00035 [Thermoprotei archaeon]
MRGNILALRNAAVSVNSVVMGLDMVPSTHHASRYAAVVVSEGRVVERKEDIDWGSVLMLIDKYRVSTIAIDNLYELGGSSLEVKRRVSNLLDKVRVVEVTRDPSGRYVKLVDLALEHGLIDKRVTHFSPLQAAEVSALLALRGVGVAVIEPTGARTLIVISRGRSYGAGGMSQERYKRSMRSAIKQVTNMVLDELKKHLDHHAIECYTKLSKHGLERSLLVVEARPSDVKRWIKPLSELIKKSGVNLKLLARLPPLSEQLPESSRPDRPLIVGLDPGIVTGLAVVDLQGKPLLVSSGLALDKVTIIRAVTKIGKPVLVASDVKTPSDLVEKIASSLGCTIYTPPKDMTIEEKRRIIYDYIPNHKEIVKNSHQRDALAAALKAFSSFKNKFSQLEAKARELGILPSQLEKAKALLVKGLTIREAVEQAMAKAETARRRTIYAVDPEVHKLKQELSKLREKVEEQSRIIKELEESKIMLLESLRQKEAKVEELEELIIRLSRRSGEARGEREREEAVLRCRLESALKHAQELATRVEQVEYVAKRLEELVQNLLDGAIVIIKEARSITKRSLDEALKFSKLKEGDVVLIHSPESCSEEGLRILVDLKPKAIITSLSKLPEQAYVFLRDHCIPVIDVDEVKIDKAGPFLYTTHELEDIIKERREQLQKEIDEEASDKLLRILREYREQRLRHLTSPNTSA